MSYSALAQSNGSESSRQPWLKASVRSFFEAIPWDGHPPLSTTVPGSGGPTSSEYPMRMRVSDFFNAIPWEGKPTIAAPIAPLELQLEPPPEEEVGDSITLEGFFDLF